MDYDTSPCDLVHDSDQYHPRSPRPRKPYRRERHFLTHRHGFGFIIHYSYLPVRLFHSPVLFLLWFGSNYTFTFFMLLYFVVQSTSLSKSSRGQVYAWSVLYGRWTPWMVSQCHLYRLDFIRLCHLLVAYDHTCYEREYELCFGMFFPSLFAHYLIVYIMDGADWLLMGGIGYYCGCNYSFWVCFFISISLRIEEKTHDMAYDFRVWYLLGCVYFLL